MAGIHRIPPILLSPQQPETLKSKTVFFNCSGPNRGHYIAIVKSHDFWLLFDDDIVEVSESGLRYCLVLNISLMFFPKNFPPPLAEN